MRVVTSPADLPPSAAGSTVTWIGHASVLIDVGRREGAHRPGADPPRRPPAAPPPDRRRRRRRARRRPASRTSTWTTCTSRRCGCSARRPHRRAGRGRRAAAPPGLPRRRARRRRADARRRPGDDRDRARRAHPSGRGPHSRVAADAVGYVLRAGGVAGLLPRRHRPVRRDGHVGADRRRPAADLGWGPTLGEGHLDPRPGGAGDRASIGADLVVPIHWGTYSPVAVRRGRTGVARRSRSHRFRSRTRARPASATACACSRPARPLRPADVDARPDRPATP